jgi:hypothetical protein
MSIMAMLNQIENDEIVLPAIQRDFVWKEEAIARLLDSVMRGYPIGIALLWETYEDIQFRPFAREFKTGVTHRYRSNGDQRRIKLVLDGQQRLQSLFVALHGGLNGKEAYLDVLSGYASDDVAEDRFLFYFLKKKEASEWQKWARAEAKLAEPERHADFPEYPVRVGELFSMGALEQKQFVDKVVSDLDLPDDDEQRMAVNVATFNDVLTKDPNILRVSTIDENLAPTSSARKSEADVLEIFVRINREGTQLSRSDLIFSMLKLNWKESAEGLPEFVRSINQGNSLGIDTDVVVRCLFAVSDLGTRLELDVLRRKSNVQKLRSNFDQCCNAIRAAVDFVVTECRCESGPLLGGVNALVPLVYYLFHTPRHDVPNREYDRVRHGMYLLAFARPFSRYADSRIGSFIRSELQPLAQRGDVSFPFQATVSRVVGWERLHSIGELAQRNDRLALHLVQGLSGAKVQYVRNSPEIDHIFPRAELRKKGFEESEINDFANFWILAQGKNRNKSDRHPKEYFSDVSDAQLRRALIDRSMLDYRRYRNFLKARRSAIETRVSKALGLSDSDLTTV